MKLFSAPYGKYRLSDNEWYEFVPYDWDEKRVKDIFKLITDLAPNDNDFELLSLYASIGVRPRKDMEQRGNKAVTTDGYWIVKKGDIIVNKLLAWMGAIGLSEYDGVTSPAYDILRELNKEVNAKFYTYLFRTEKAQAIFKKHSRGIMDVRLRLYFDKFGAITVPFPPISEQKTIAHYLDTKTDQIDRKIDLLTQKAALYGDLKQSLINETVTRGLDKSVPMKDSGIEWLGEVPEHWKVRRLKDLAQIKTGSKDTINSIEDGIYPFFVRSQTIEKINSYSFDGEAILTAGDGVGVGKVFHYIKGKFDYHQRVYRISNFRGVLGKFLFYYIKSNFYKEAFRLNAKSTVDSLRMPMFENFPVVFGSIKEQKAIADYLDTKTAQIDQIIQTINTQIEKLKELRKTLINDVVTGKIKVV
jgi:type I restriction enzyme S subunit